MKNTTAQKKPAPRAPKVKAVEAWTCLVGERIDLFLMWRYRASAEGFIAKCPNRSKLRIIRVRISPVAPAKPRGKRKAVKP